MKKIMVLALLAIVLMVAPAFAVERHLFPVPNASFANGLAPASTNNNETCDIGTAPAATLLLPYFDVDVTFPRGLGQRSTLFTITNTSRFPQIAHVTVWTDWSFPVLDFNLFLTGYDVAPIDLYDVIARGNIGGDRIFNSSQTVPSNSGVPGAAPASNTSNPNFSAAGIGCGTLPGALPGAPTGTTGASGLVADIQNALINGIYPTGGAFCSPHTFSAASDPTGSVSIVDISGRTLPAGTVAPVVGLVGGQHPANHAIGYVTVDVANNCSTTLPTTSSYFSGEILFDNVLIGDYQQVGTLPNAAGGTTNVAGGSPMVHIRAVPEGGPAGSQPGTNLPFTFYDRYTPVTNRVIDRRQPLPSTFGARYINGNAGGVTLATNYQIWREGLTGPDTLGVGDTRVPTTCTTAATNSALLVTSIIRFDQHENATATSGSNVCSPCINVPGTLPETSSTNVAATSAVSPSNPFPPSTTATTDVGGWMYLNLSNNATTFAPLAPSVIPGARTVATLSAQRAGFGSVGGGANGRTTSQNWVTVNMQAPSLGMSALFDAAWLANGCSAAPAAGAVIAPGSQRTSGALVCPAGVACPAGTQPPASTP